MSRSKSAAVLGMKKASMASAELATVVDSRLNIPADYINTDLAGNSVQKSENLIV